MSPFMSVEDTSRFINKTTCGLTSLMVAAKEADLDACLALLKSGESANATTEFGVTTLHFAAVNKNHGADIVMHLVSEQNVDVGSEDVDGEEAIFYAVRIGNFRVAQVLLDVRKFVTNNLLHFFLVKDRVDVARVVHAWNKSLIARVEPDERNGLHLAAQFSDLHACKWLISKGINVASKSTLGTAMHRAPLNKKHGIELIRFFRSRGLGLNEASGCGFVPLQSALLKEHVEIAEEMLRLGARVDVDLMFYCIEKNKLKSAEVLHRINRMLVRAKDGMKRSALQVAAEVADVDMCRWIVKCGVPADGLNLKWQTTAVHHAGFNREHGAEIVEMLFGLQLDMNAQDFAGFTPVCYAVFDRNYHVARQMLKFGADLRACSDGMNVFHVCICRNDLEGARFVLSMDDDIAKSVRSRGENALHTAAAFADLAMCQWLCGLGVLDVLAASRHSGDTVLHWAATNEQHGKSLVPFFVSKFVDVNEENAAAHTAICVALSKENLGVAVELLKAGASIDNLRFQHDENILHFCTRLNKLQSAKLVLTVDDGLLTERTSAGITALHVAATWADLEFCKFLVEKGADIHARDSLGRSVLNFVPLHAPEKKNYFCSLGIKNPVLF